MTNDKLPLRYVVTPIRALDETRLLLNEIKSDARKIDSWDVSGAT